MSINTYAELKTAVANFLARTDLTDRIPEFIEIAEARINRELETREQEKRATATISSEYTSLPTDLRQLRSVKINSSPIKTLTYYNPDMLDQEFSSSGAGTPQAYSIVGQELKVRPIPTSSTTAEIVYIGNVESLSDSNTSTTLLIRSPDLYLYGSLCSAYKYLMDTPNASLYDGLFSRALEEVRYDDQRSQYSQGRLQMRSSYNRQLAMR